MIVETERLLIRPLTYEQLDKYSRADGALENELQINVQPRYISPDLADALQQMLQAALANPDNDYQFFTLWTLIDKQKLVMVGDLCFKGQPNANGEIEVGYGTHEAFWNQGYMTEALGAMIGWAEKRTDIQAILAETDQANMASCRTLTKNKFEPFRQEGDMIWWRLSMRAKQE